VILRLVLGRYTNVPTEPEPLWAPADPAGELPPLLGPIKDVATGGPDGQWLEQVLVQIAATYHAGTAAVPGLNRAFAQYEDLRTTHIPLPPPPVDRMFLEAVLEELRVQESLEERWQNLVRTVAPEAGDQESVFELLKLVIKQAQHDAQTLYTGLRPVRIPYGEALPPQFEQSLAALVRK
jgi:hypothetical protein